MIPSLKTSRLVKRLIIHCAATKASMDIGAVEIKKWHVEGNKWKDIGYHHVIRRSGKLETGRPLIEVGSHTQGYNAGSIGVCIVGGLGDKGQAEANFTPAQWETLKEYVKAFKATYPTATVHGHNEFAAKACPSFNVQTWLKGL
jgi:N-acetylmuramoyl-L-alanine amidase